MLDHKLMFFLIFERWWGVQIGGAMWVQHLNMVVVGVVFQQQENVKIQRRAPHQQLFEPIFFRPITPSLQTLFKIHFLMDFFIILFYRDW